MTDAPRRQIRFLFRVTAKERTVAYFPPISMLSQTCTTARLGGAPSNAVTYQQFWEIPEYQKLKQFEHEGFRRRRASFGTVVRPYDHGLLQEVANALPRGTVRERF